MKKTYSARSALFSDSPIASVDRDEFGRAEFAKMLAESIAHVPADDGFVYALNATWGSGKTSTLNFVRKYLTEKNKVDTDKQFVVVQFNPWWFSGGDSLAHDFFRQFRGALTEQGKEVGEDYRKKLGRLAGQIRTFSSVLTPFPGLGPWAKLVEDMSGGVERLFPDPAADIHGVRKEIHDSLRGMEKLRVLVVIDDLDRIQPNETLEIFRLIKGVADFPNTIYLLSFDRSVVVDALAGKFMFDTPDHARENSRKYLGKIIQMTLDLPPVDEFTLHNYFDKHLKSIFRSMQECGWNEDDDAFWNEIFWKCASRFVRTPRDAKRWLNNVGATYPVVRGEVNPADFTVIQCLRTFSPEIYHAVGENKPLFVETPSDDVEKVIESVSNLKKENLKRQAEALYEKVFRPLNERGTTADYVLSAIFPFWNAHGHRTLGTGPRIIPQSVSDIHDENSRLGNYARHPDIFDRYFRLSLSIGDFSGPDMEIRIALADKPEKFADMLLTLAKEHVPGSEYPRLRVFLKRLAELHLDEKVLSRTGGILRAFLAVGDKPEIADRKSLTGNGMRWIAYDFLRAIGDKEQRFQICLNAFKEGEAVVDMWELIFMFQHDLNNYDKNPATLPVLSREHFNALKDIAVRKLENLAEKGDVWDWCDPLWLLYRLDQEVSPDARRECVRKAISLPDGFADFCGELLKCDWRKDGQRLADMSPQELADKAKEHLQNTPSLNEARRDALRRLVDMSENPSIFPRG